MTVDVRLLAALTLPLALIFSIFQLVLWLRHRERRSHLHWAVVNFVTWIGVMILVARQTLPLWVTTSLANTILISASFLQWGAMAHFCGRQVSWPLFAGLTLAFFACFQGMWLVTDDLGLRVLLASLSSAFLNFCIAFELLRAQQQVALKSRAFLSSVFAIHALFFLFRSATAVTLDSSQDFLQATGIQNFTVTVAAIKVTAWNFGTVWMVREALRVGAR